MLVILVLVKKWFKDAPNDLEELVDEPEAKLAMIENLARLYIGYAFKDPSKAEELKQVSIRILEDIVK